MEWQPIETASKTGEYIMLYDGKYHVARWSDDRWESGWLIDTYPDGEVNGRLMVYDPTHWRPLPESPNAQLEPRAEAAKPL